MNSNRAKQAILKRLACSTSQDDCYQLSPQQGRLSEKSPEELLEHFHRVLSAHNTKVTWIAALTELPQAVADYIDQLGANELIYGGNHPLLNALAWEASGIQWREETFTSDSQVAIASAEYGIADTGTLVIQSSEKNPPRNNFLAEHHIVVLRKDAILPYSEDVWQRLANDYSVLPRAINFISGPSSSADVGLKLEYGAHGPRTLGVFVY